MSKFLKIIGLGLSLSLAASASLQAGYYDLYKKISNMCNGALETVTTYPWTTLFTAASVVLAGFMVYKKGKSEPKIEKKSSFPEKSGDKKSSQKVVRLTLNTKTEDLFILMKATTIAMLLWA